MKSLKESLGLARSTTSSIDGLPKSAAGILPHNEEEALNRIWREIIKSEEGCQKLSSESAKYCSALHEVHTIEERIIKLIGDSNINLHSSELHQIMDEYLSVIVETKKLCESTSDTAYEVVNVSPAQYHALYAHLDEARKRRDATVTEIERCQERLDRIKLKGRRSTDVLVEKDRLVNFLRGASSRLMSDSQQFHESRVTFLRSCVDASVHNQINYYGTITSEFNKYINLGRPSPQQGGSCLVQAMNSHLNAIRALTIVWMKGPIERGIYYAPVSQIPSHLWLLKCLRLK